MSRLDPARARRRPAFCAGLWGPLLWLAFSASPCSGEVAEGITSPTPPPASFYFFSPDWRPSDLGQLAAAVERVLSSSGLPVAFQAFTRYEDFDAQVSANPPVFVIAPAWTKTSPTTGFPTAFVVLAEPVRRSKATYRKALMTRSNVDSIDDLAKGSIAATAYSMGAGAPEPILTAFHLPAESARIVPVPKDVDALLALTFGQVDAAMVTSEQYALLAKSNPAEAERLRVLAFSPEIDLPPVFAQVETAPELRGRFQAAITHLQDTAEGKAILAMLGFDAFVPVPDDEAAGEAATSSTAEQAASVAKAAPATSSSRP